MCPFYRKASSAADRRKQGRLRIDAGFIGSNQPLPDLFDQSMREAERSRHAQAVRYHSE